MNLLEALNNENSDELQKRIRLLDVSARDCPKRKADRVEYLRGYLFSTGLHFQIARMSEAEQTVSVPILGGADQFIRGNRIVRIGFFEVTDLTAAVMPLADDNILCALPGQLR